MTTQNNMQSKKFITADNDGNALYTGDQVFSLFHDARVTLTGLYIWGPSGEVFLVCNLFPPIDGKTEGTVAINNIRRITLADLVDDFESLATLEDDYTNNGLSEFLNLDDDIPLKKFIEVKKAFEYVTEKGKFNLNVFDLETFNAGQPIRRITQYINLDD